MRSACVHNPGELPPDVSTGSTIIRLFHLLQPAEQKRILDLLMDELHKTGRVHLLRPQGERSGLAGKPSVVQELSLTPLQPCREEEDGVWAVLRLFSTC